MLALSLDQTFLRQADRRADDGARDVFIDQAEVIIARRVSGVRKRIRLGARAYRGVVLTLDRDEAGRDAFRVSLWHPDRDFSVTLDEASDDSNIVASWKAWAAYLGLPKFIERQPGQLEGAERRLGALALGSARVLRRRGGTIAKRRGRQPLRRKVGDGSRSRDVISERCIISGWEGPCP